MGNDDIEVQMMKKKNIIKWVVWRKMRKIETFFFFVDIVVNFSSSFAQQ